MMKKILIIMLLISLLINFYVSYIYYFGNNLFFKAYKDYCTDENMSDEEKDFYKPFCSMHYDYNFLPNISCSTRIINNKKVVDVIYIQNIATKLIPNHYLKFKKSRSITLRNTKIEKIPKNDNFKEMNILFVISSYLDRYLEIENSKLTYLHIDKNETTIEQIKIKNISNLNELFVRSCGLKKILFEDGFLDKLEILNLTDNDITDEVLKNLISFERLPKIKKVILKKNKVENKEYFINKHRNIEFVF